MVTYNVDVVVTDPILQDVSVIVSESSAGVLLGGLDRHVLTKNSDADNDASWKTPGGFTYIQDTTPTPTRLGETFFDISTGATGGYAYVAIDNGSGGLIWLQYAPGTSSLIPTPWTGVTYQNSWVDYGATTPVQIRKIGDMVQLRGRCKNGTFGATAFELPVGFRPAYVHNQTIMGATYSASIALAIPDTGLVTLAGVSNAEVNFGTVQFSTIV